ncbi:MAG: InlB B-repeat-containing protein, partial [Clostridia bacterium]|nr:InlB B-repeat-containing protein [Clostridia bacterium]
MRFIKKTLSLILIFSLILGVFSIISAQAAEQPLDIKISTNKSSYNYNDTIKLKIDIKNNSNQTLNKVKVEIASVDYGLPKNESASKTIGSISSGKAASADYSLILSKNFNGLNFFQRLILIFKYFFSPFVLLPKSINTSGKTYIKKTQTITQNGIPADITIYVFYDKPVSSSDKSDNNSNKKTDTPYVIRPGSNHSEKYNGDGATFSMTMLDVGQGLSILFQSNGKYMIYDGGGKATSSYVVAYLKKNNISKLDYMIASHYDEDHIAGLIGILNTITVSTVYTPNYPCDTEIYNSFISKLSSSGADNKHPNLGDTFSFGGTNIQFISPATYSETNENSNSLAIRATYGSFSCILTGDAETDAENDMITGGYAVDSDLLVIGHHGSSSSSSDNFVKAVAPEYAFISVGAANSYGHPTAETLSTLKSNNVTIFRSDELGTVICYSDGKKYWFSTDPSTNWAENSYVLSYDANGGSGAPPMQTGLKTYTISKTRPTREGYKFLGWTKNPGSASEIYFAGEKITVTDNTTLYAIWEKAAKSYTLSYNANGGSGA